jgi:diguanylate cyclase (GGDEF)-like protein/PAS domain S-box-containing protein
MSEHSLERERDQWQAMADQTAMLLWITDPEGSVTGFNKTWLEWRGRPLDDELASGWLQGLHDDDVPRWHSTLTDAKNTHSHVHTHLRLRNADGVHLRVAVSGRPWRTSDGLLGGYVFSGVPESRQRPLEDLTHSTDLFRATIEALQEGVIVVDAKGRFVWVNQAAELLLGLQDGHWTGEHYILNTSELDVVDEHGRPVPVEDRPSVVAQRTGKPVSHQTLAWHVQDGGLRWFSVNSRPLQDTKGEVIAVVTSFLDVTAQKHATDNARHEARHDALTGLVNRWGLRDSARTVMERTPRQGSDVALLYCDLDHFKQFNDSLGHAGGDELLQIVAARINGAVRSSDVVARIGGDEVVVILDEVHGIDGAMTAAEKVRASVSRAVTIRGREIVPHLSIGVALLPSFDDFDETLNRADEAMYAAKEAGRNRCVTLDDSSGQR